MIRETLHSDLICCSVEAPDRYLQTILNSVGSTTCHQTSNCYYLSRNSQYGIGMPYCSICGTQVRDTATYCPQCGNKQSREKPKVWTEEVEVAGNQLLARVEQLIHEANVQRIVIKQQGRTLLEIPLTWAAAGAVLAPVLAAVGALAALVTDCTITIERSDQPTQSGS